MEEEPISQDETGRAGPVQPTRETTGEPSVKAEEGKVIVLQDNLGTKPSNY